MLFPMQNLAVLGLLGVILVTLYSYNFVHMKYGHLMIMPSMITTLISCELIKPMYRHVKICGECVELS